MSARLALFALAAVLAGCPTTPATQNPARPKPNVTVEEEAPIEDLLRRLHYQILRGDLDGAQVSLNRILIGHPEHLETRVLQAMLKEAQGQRKEAEAIWAEVERILVYQGKEQPFALEESLELAALHYVSRDRPERARVFLDELWRRFPTGELTARAQLRAAELEAAAHRWGRAVQRCGELVRIRPEHSSAERCRRLAQAAQRMLELGPEPAADAQSWRWENPLPQGNTLHDVSVTPKGEVVAVGDAGTILRRRAGQTQFGNEASPTRWPLRRLWGTEKGELWAVGGAGIILRHDGKSWQVARPAAPEQGELWGVWASSDQVIAVGDGGLMVSGAAGRWSTQKIAQGSLRGVWGEGQRLLAVGDGGTLLQRSGAGPWQTLPSDCYEDLWSVWGQGDSPVFLVGNRRTVVNLEGERAKESVVGRAHFRDVWGGGPKEAWAVGTAGDIVRWSGGRWRSESSGTLLDIYGVGGRRGGGDEVWAVGEGGTILQRRGTRWSTVSGGLHQDLVAATAAQGGWAVGQRGLLLRRSQGRWVSEPPLPVGRYRDLHGDGQRLIAVGDAGLLVVRAARGPWRRIATDVPDDLTAVAGFEGGAVIVGTGGTILRLQGERVIRDASPSGLDLRGAWAASPRDLWAVGHRGLVLRFDGQSWRQAPDTGTLQDLLAVWGAAGAPLTVAGANGTLLQLESDRWRAVTVPLQQNLVDVWGSSGQRVVVVSDRGGIMQLDGGTWRLHRSPASCLTAVHGEGGQVWAVGCRGTILTLGARR